jgi:GNAT superfamily N-acetyltransferase
MPVSEGLLKREDLANIDRLIEEMKSETPSVEHFLEHCFGFCIEQSNTLVGWCLSEYNGRKRCEIGIETMEEFQRRGIGTAVTEALLMEASKRGYSEVGWHSFANNQASIATAKKVGFKKINEYVVLSLWFNEAINLAIHGDQRYLIGDYEGAIVCYEKACAENSAPTWIFWNTACIQANAGNKVKAFRFLNKAISRGFRDSQYIMSSKHFKPYHDTIEWREIAARLAHEATHRQQS